MIIKTLGRHFALRMLIILTIQLAFFVAKFIGLLTWPWVWVFSPFIIMVAVIIVAAFIVLLIE